MKKFMSLVVALIATVVLGSSAFAVSYSTATVVATASFEGTATFTFNLKNMADSKDATALSWTSADAFVMGSTVAWVAADQYAVVAATVTKAGFAVYMNTNNKGAKSDLQPNEGSYGGLYRVAGEGGAYRGYIPVAYSYFATKQETVPTFEGAGKEETSEDRSDRWLSDISNSDYDPNYTTIAALNGPTFFTKDTAKQDVQYPSPKVVNNTAYMYFFGGFANVIGGDTYTTTINVVQVTE